MAERARRDAHTRSRARNEKRERRPLRMRRRDHRIYMRNRVTGEVRGMVRGTPAGDRELRTLREQWHPQVPHLPLWEQVRGPEWQRG